MPGSGERLGCSLQFGAQICGRRLCGDFDQLAKGAEVGLGVCVVGEVGVQGVECVGGLVSSARRPHHLRQEKERAEWGDAWQDTGKVFTKEDGARLHPETVTHRARKVPKSKQRPSQPKPTRALRSRSEGFTLSPQP